MDENVISLSEFVDRETTGRSVKKDLRLWLRLLSATTMIEAAVRTRLHTRFDETLRRFDCLAALDRAQEPLAMGELSRRLMVSNGNVTGLIERLMQDGLVERKRSETDRRTSYVGLTAAGEKHFRHMARDHEKWIAAAFEQLADDEIEQLMELLGKVKRSAHTHLIAPGA